ncbi:MAG: EndoU domain-containing protein [Bacteroidota bacterium]
MDKDSINPGPRIICYESSQMNIDDSFDSIENLKKSDKQYIQFKKTNADRAELILEPEFIVNVKDLVLTANPKDRPPHQDYLLLMHTLSGKSFGKKYAGLHFVPYPIPPWIILTEEDPSDINGVWRAQIKIKRNSKILSKRGQRSTLFPRDWNFQRVFDECLYALANKSLTNESNQGKSYNSSTRSGVPVKIFYGSDGKFKTIYPAYNGES